MVTISIFSQNQDFKDDLTMQLSKFIPDIVISAGTPDIIIVDEDVQQCRLLRQQHLLVPIVLLTEKTVQKTDNLNLAVHKPFLLTHLLDILRAANNKLDNSVEGYIRLNGYELRPNTREIVDLTDNTVIKLTEKEVKIIKYLYKNRDRYVGKNELQTNVWQYSEDVTTHTIETHIYRLRQKVERETEHCLILTEEGGYKLITDGYAGND